MENEVRFLNMDDIIPNRFQPREIFDEQALNELAESIRQHGVLEPILVRPVSNKFEIIAGERRYKASAIAGLTKIPALIKNIDDKESALVAFIENEQRRDVSAIEKARTANRILKTHNMTQEELSKSLGISQSTLANRLRLLDLPMEIQEALMRNEISERHARSLLSVKDTAKQIELLNKIKEKRMTVRELDGEIKNMYNNQNMNYSNESMNDSFYSPLTSNNMAQPQNTNLNSQQPSDNFMNYLNNYDNSYANSNMTNNNQSANNAASMDSGFMDFLNQYDNSHPIPANQPVVEAPIPVQMPQMDAVPVANNMQQTNDDSFMNYLNNYDANNAVNHNVGAMNTQPSNPNMGNNNGFMNFLDNYDNNYSNLNDGLNQNGTQPMPSVPSTPEVNNNSFMNFLDNYDNSHPVQSNASINSEPEDLNAYMNSYENNPNANNSNLVINNVNPPITSNFGANDYVESNPNYVDISTSHVMGSVDEIINELKGTIDKIKAESKFKIDTDEINFDDLYQITIKIDKRDF